MRSRFVLVGALVLLVLGRVIAAQSSTERVTGRHMMLVEGWYTVQRIDDPITLVVTPQPPSTATDDRPFAVRLASLSIRPDRRPQSPHLDTFDLTRLVRGNDVYLRFDRQRFDLDHVPIAYAFVGDRLINAELVRHGVAAPRMVPGNSSRLQRQIRAAAAGAARPAP